MNGQRWSREKRDRGRKKKKEKVSWKEWGNMNVESLNIGGLRCRYIYDGMVGGSRLLLWLCLNPVVNLGCRAISGPPKITLLRAISGRKTPKEGRRRQGGCLKTMTDNSGTDSWEWEGMWERDFAGLDIRTLRLKKSVIKMSHELLDRLVCLFHFEHANYRLWLSAKKKKKPVRKIKRNPQEKIN